MAPAEAQPAPSITVGATPPPADGKKCALILVPSNDVTVASRARAGAANVRAAARARAAAHEIRLMGLSVVALPGPRPQHDGLVHRRPARVPVGEARDDAPRVVSRESAGDP